MPPTRSSPHPIYVSTELANIPFRFRRKSLSEDDLPNPDYYLVPPSPSLSPSRSFSMSSSPPSSPTTLNTSPTRPHLDTANIRPASSPTHPTPYHAYGYAYTYSRGLSHPGPSDHDLLPPEPKRVLSSSRSHHPIVPPANPIRSTLPPLPSDRHSLRPSFSSVSQNALVHDEEEDDIEDYGFALDLDDILAGSSPTRRISFTTSSERDRPFVRPPVRVKPRSRAFPKESDPGTRPFTTTTHPSFATPTEHSTRPRPREVQCDSTRTSAAPADVVPPPLARPRTPIRPRSVARHAASPLPRSAGGNADLDDTLPPSSPIPPSPVSSPFCTPSAPRPSESGCEGSGRGHTARRATTTTPRPDDSDLQQLDLDSDVGSDLTLTLPPSSPIRDCVPSTPARYAENNTANVDRVNMDTDTDMDMDMDGDGDLDLDLDLADLVASPPSPTLDALRITSRVRVAVGALLNPVPSPAPATVFAPAPPSVAAAVVDDDDDEEEDDVLPQLVQEAQMQMPVDDETETATPIEAEAEAGVEIEAAGEAAVEAEAEAGGEKADGKIDVVVLSIPIPDGDVTPLVLPALEAGEEVAVAADAGGPDDEDEACTSVDASVGEEAMATEIGVQVQIAASERELTPKPEPKPPREHEHEPEPCPVPTTTPWTPSRRSSRGPSEPRAHTPHAEAAQISSDCQETPSSPLSPTPSSIADADADVDVDVEMGLGTGMDCDADSELPAPAPALPDPVSMPVAGPSRSRVSSRAPSPALAPRVHVEGSAEPPRKKMRREEDPDVSHAKTVAVAVAKPKVKAKRARTPTFTDSESEGEAEKAADLKPRKKAASRQDPAKTTKTKVAHHHQRKKFKRPRAVLSDDETESDSPAAPASVRAPALSLPLPVKKKDGVDKEPRECERERKKEKPKKQRAKAKAKDAQTDLELENEPVHPHPHLHPHASTSNINVAHAKQQPARSSSLSVSGAPPKSATNIARPELPLPAPSAFDAHAHAPQTSVSKPHKPPRLAEDPDASPERTSADAASAKPKPKPSATSTLTSTATSPGKSRAPRDHADEIEAEADALVAAFELPLPAPELEGMLIETLATARASSLATSALFGALMAARPALRDMPLPALKDAKAEDAENVDKGEKEGDGKSRGRGAGAKADTASRRAWVPALEAVLEAGWRRSGVFGKIVNSGTDLANHALALEARWFYDPDQDADVDRAALVRTMMRRPGQRSETKKAKHYYWRPLPKISRWDDEDEL